MNKPTRKQTRAYALLCAILAVVLLIIIIFPHKKTTPPPSDHSALSTEIALFGDSIIAVKEQRKPTYTKRQPRQFEYDTSYRQYYREKKELANRRNEMVVDINHADTIQLQELYGIGPAFARHIVKYRNLLGGYTRKEQLMEVYGMTNDRYEALIPHITVDTTAVEKIAINEATVEQMKKHPYLDYYQAKAIADYRAKGNRFRGKEDLLKISIIDEATIRKISDYIQF